MKALAPVARAMAAAYISVWAFGFRSFGAVGCSLCDLLRKSSQNLERTRDTATSQLSQDFEHTWAFSGPF